MPWPANAAYQAQVARGSVVRRAADAGSPPRDQERNKTCLFAAREELRLWTCAPTSTCSGKQALAANRKRTSHTAAVTYCGEALLWRVRLTKCITLHQKLCVWTHHHPPTAAPTHHDQAHAPRDPFSVSHGQLCTHHPRTPLSLPQTPLSPDLPPRLTLSTMNLANFKVSDTCSTPCVL